MKPFAWHIFSSIFSCSRIMFDKATVKYYVRFILRRFYIILILVFSIRRTIPSKIQCRVRFGIRIAKFLGLAISIHFLNRGEEGKV